jgi:hypothetical protein
LQPFFPEIPGEKFTFSSFIPAMPAQKKAASLKIRPAAERIETETFIFVF